MTTSAKVAAHLPQGAGYTSAKVAELHHRTSPEGTSPREREENESRARERARFDRFDRFWQAWPNQKSEPKAVPLFAKICRDEKTLAEILAGIERYIATKPDDRDWMNPLTFLYQRRWEDEPADRQTPEASAKQIRRLTSR